MNVDEIEEENDKKCVIKLVFYIILKKGICKVEFKEDLQINGDDCFCKFNYWLR